MDISVGVLTYHHHSIKSQEHYEKCIGNCQAILNPLLDLGFSKHHLFAGANSIARLMVGYRYNISLSDIASFTVGSYYQNHGEFNRKGILTPYTFGDLMPIAGFDLNYKSLGLILTYPVSVMYWKF